MSRQKTVAMILAGGQGSRLGVLTQSIAKPAVPYGSRYRIIDFPLSNCTNSGIETVGVLTQYQPLELNAYIGNGHSWDLDRNNGGTYILPPYQSTARSDWYKGTANAIFQNIPFIDAYRPKYVLILSGDHIYKMNYAKMVDFHETHEADATIAVIEVPWEDTHRFGIMNTDEEKRITEFEEKPAQAKSNLASMGIYCFSWPVLRKYLIKDEADKKSSNDFGKNVIPQMLGAGLKMMAYPFAGYWKDVGTIQSLYDSNMDLLDTPEIIDLYDDSWRIYSRSPSRPSHYIGDTATLQNTAVTDGDEIFGEVIHSVLSHSVFVEEGAVVSNSILMPGVTVKRGARIDKVIVGMNSIIGENVQIGPFVENGDSHFVNTRFCADQISVIEELLEIKKGAKIAANSMIYKPKSGEEIDYVIPVSENF
jgi:glucose-1-phosphate adenylyltransferase